MDFFPKTNIENQKLHTFLNTFVKQHEKATRVSFPSGWNLFETSGEIITSLVLHTTFIKFP